MSAVLCNPLCLREPFSTALHSHAQVNARILPPPQLIYNKQQQPLRVGTAGSWNMVSSTFCEPAGFESFGIVSFCNERFCGGGQQNPDSLEVQ